MDGEEMEGLSTHSREVAKGSFWGLLGNLAIKLVSFAYVILIARAASQNDVGLFYLALSIVSIVTVFSDVGISNALLRYVPYFEARNEHGKANGLLNWSYVILIFTGIVLTALLWWQADFIGSLYHSTALPDAIRMISAFILLNNLFRLHFTYLWAKMDIPASQFVQNLQNLLKLVLTVLLFWFYGASVIIMIVAFLLSYFFTVIATYLHWPEVRYKGGNSSGPATVFSHNELLREVAPVGIVIAVVQSLSVILISTDKLLLGYLADPVKAIALVAVYSMATNLATVLLIFPSAVGSIFLPLVSRLEGANDRGKMRAVMETAQRWSLFITLPFALVFMSFPAEILRVFYGSAYASGAAALAIFTFGLVLLTLSYMTSLALGAIRAVGLEFKISLIVCAVNIGLNWVLIPSLGIEGAAAASVAGFAVGLLLLQYYGKTLLDFSFPPEIWRLLAAGAVVFIVLLAAGPLVSSLSTLLPQPGEGAAQAYLLKFVYLLCLAVLVFLSMLVFMGCALLFKCFRSEDISLMKSAMRRAMMPQSIISLAEKVASYGVSGRK